VLQKNIKKADYYHSEHYISDEHSNRHETTILTLVSINVQPIIRLSENNFRYLLQRFAKIDNRARWSDMEGLNVPDLGHWLSVSESMLPVNYLATLAWMASAQTSN
jgi:hypothetical protein